MDLYPPVIRDIVYGYVSHSERHYFTTGNLGWVLHNPYAFDIDFVYGLKQYFKFETLLNIAAAQNRFDIVKLTSKRCARYLDAIDLACANGNLQIVKFLYEVRRIQLKIKTWSQFEKCPPGIHHAVQNNQWHILEFICQKVNHIDQAINVCCQENKPEYLLRLLEIIPMSQEQLFQQVIHSPYALNVYKWIIEEYIKLKDAESKRKMLCFVYALVPHFDTRILDMDVNQEWQNIPVAGNVKMLDWLLARSTFDGRRWIRQAEKAVVVNDVELLKRCPIMPVQFDIIEIAIKHGNVEIVKLLKMHRGTRDIAIRHQQYHLIQYTNGPLIQYTNRPSYITFDEDLCMELCEWNPTSLYGENKVFFLQLVYQLQLRFEKDVAYHERKWLDYVDDPHVKNWLRECFVYAFTDNVYWFGQCVSDFANAYENRSWLLVVVLDRKAYHCLEWMFKNKFIHNLPTVTFGFTMDHKMYDHKQLMILADEMLRERVNRSCCILI